MKRPSFNRLSFAGISEHMFTKALFPLGVLLLIVVLGLITMTLGPITAIKGAYGLVGLTIAWALFTLTRGSDNRQATRLNGGASVRRDAWSTSIREACGILPFVVVLLSVIVALTINTRLPVLFVLLPLGYLSLIVLLVFDSRPGVIVPRAAALFAVPVLTKYLASGYYFGNTDTFEHVAAARALLAQGRLGAISSHYGLYAQVPGLHTATAALSSMTQTPMYDSFMLLGIVFSVASVALVYGLFSTVFDEALSMYITVAYSVLVPPLFYADYFFPQAMTTILFLTLLFMATQCLGERSVIRRRYTAIGVLLAVIIPFVHHLTVIFFVAFISVLLLPNLVSNLMSRRTLDIPPSTPNLRLFMIVSVIALTHWVINLTGFLRFLGEFVAARLFEYGPTINDSGGIRSVIGLGEPYQSQTVSDAFVSLIYFDGIYYTLLAAVFILGAAAAIVRWADYEGVTGYVVLGLLGSLFVLRTPLINLSSRIALSIAPFFAILIGIGLKRLVTYNETKVRRVAIVVLLFLFVTAPVVVADDQYRLQSGPNLYDVHDVPEVQRDFSAEEWSQVETTGQYVSQSGASVNTFTITKRALSSMEADAVEFYTISAQNDSVISERPFVYRETWTEHRVGFAGERVGSLVMGDQWLRDSVRTEDKVYTTGSVGVLWDGEEAMLTNSTDSIW